MRIPRGIRLTVLGVMLSAALLAGATALLSPLTCRWSSQPVTWDDNPPIIADRSRQGGLDVTFLVAADTHFGYEGMAGANERQVRVMNNIEGKQYPPRIGGAVARPQWLIVAGDLTDTGTSQEWQEFLAHYGLTGKDGLLKYPTYIGSGNHDRWGGRRHVVKQVAAINGGLYYSWDHGDLHLICLDEAPTREGLNWLRSDLAQTGRQRPIVIFQHFPLAGPYNDSNWFGKGTEKQLLAALLKGFNVIGIFHGHYHGTGRYRWEGFDIYNVGSPKHAARSFAVVRITDDRMTVAEFDWDLAGDWVWTHQKRINQASATGPGARPAGAGESVRGRL